MSSKNRPSKLGNESQKSLSIEVKCIILVNICLRARWFWQTAYPHRRGLGRSLTNMSIPWYCHQGRALRNRKKGAGEPLTLVVLGGCPLGWIREGVAGSLF